MIRAWIIVEGDTDCTMVTVDEVDPLIDHLKTKIFTKMHPTFVGMPAPKIVVRDPNTRAVLRNIEPLTLASLNGTPRGMPESPFIVDAPGKVKFVQYFLISVYSIANFPATSCSISNLPKLHQTRVRRSCRNS
jgi:hypothetical protein